MKIILTVWYDIRSRKNLDLYIIIILAVVVTVLGVTGQVGQIIISSAILATLAVVAMSLLINRHENEEIQKTLSSISSGENLADKFIKHEYDRTRLRQLLSNSHVAFFWGPYLTTHILLLKDIIKERLQDDFQVRFLLMDPYGIATNLKASLSKDKDVQYVRKRIESSCLELQHISQEIPTGKLKFLVMDYEQPYSIIAFDPDLPSGRIFVRLNSLDTSNAKRPTFELTNEGDVYWFNFFVHQFESAWKIGHDWVPNNER